MVSLPPIASELILRAGVPLETNLVNAYGPERGYPGLYGLSVLLHAGYALDQLARAGNFRHGRVSYATVGQIESALRAAGYDLRLTHTSSASLPDHHALSVEQRGQLLRVLPPDAALALSQMFVTVPNPHQQP